MDVKELELYAKYIRLYKQAMMDFHCKLHGIDESQVVSIDYNAIANSIEDALVEAYKDK